MTPRSGHTDLSGGIRQRRLKSDDPVIAELPVVSEGERIATAPSERGTNHCGVVTTLVCGVALAFFAYLAKSS